MTRKFFNLDKYSLSTTFLTVGGKKAQKTKVILTSGKQIPQQHMERCAHDKATGKPSQNSLKYLTPVRVAILKKIHPPNVHSSTIYNSQDEAATIFGSNRLSTDRQMGKEGDVHTHSGILLGHKNKEIMPFIHGRRKTVKGTNFPLQDEEALRV